MSNQEVQQGRELFTRNEQDEMLTALAQPLSQDRPIARLETGLEPGGRKTHRWYMNTKYQFVGIGGLMILVGLVGHHLIFGGQKSPDVVARENKTIQELRTKLKQRDDEDAAKTRENASLTQAAQFEAIPITVPKNQNRKPLAPAVMPRQQPVTPRNIVRIPRTQRVIPLFRPQLPRPASRPQVVANRGTPKPSLNDCIDIARQGFKVPACASYRIQEKANPQQQPIAFNKTPKPTAKQPIQLKRLNKPTTVAYTPKAPKAKPSYQVNYAAGEIQTVDQFQEEFYGSGQTSAPQLSRMTAKVIDHVEWLSPEDAQKVIIPLQITSGPQKGQTAEAKIDQINGLQFTAYLVSLNGQQVDPEKLELRRQNTKYLRADLKHQGGESFGDKVLETVTAIGGEIASDQLANVRGGNQISRLVSSPKQQGREVTQYWKFDGKVEIVPVPVN